MMHEKSQVLEGVGETKVQWSEKGKDEKTMTLEGAEEVKQREIDQAFRKWLERKRKQSESERLAREQRESALETQRSRGVLHGEHFGRRIIACCVSLSCGKLRR